MRIRHGLTCVFLRPACSPADHLGHQVLESRRRNAMVGFVHLRVGVQSRVYHDSVDEVIHHGGDAIDTPKSVVKREFFRWLHNKFSFYRTSITVHLWSQAWTCYGVSPGMESSKRTRIAMREAPFGPCRLRADGMRQPFRCPRAFPQHQCPQRFSVRSRDSLRP